MELQTVVIATPAQRTAKAAKMIGYISKTHEKVNALIQTAQQHGVDPNRVETVSLDVLSNLTGTDQFGTGFETNTECCWSSSCFPPQKIKPNLEYIHYILYINPAYIRSPILYFNKYLL